MPAFERDGIRFHYFDSGEGLPFFLQHGLGGDTGQPSGLFRPPPGVRLICLDCRAHGETRPVGDESMISLGTFASDVDALRERLGIGRAVAGGISMGAAVALVLALRRPSWLAGLVLARPAWLAGPMEENARNYALIAKLIREKGARRGRDEFLRSGVYAAARERSPDAAESLVKQFESPRAEDGVARLERIPADAPCRDLRQLEEIRVPALVLANRRDPIHPFEYGEELARRIPDAELREIPSKSEGQEKHAGGYQRALEDFFSRRFSESH
jgi:pimeloyl-ACP methyl ester carboxylesterase